MSRNSIKIKNLAAVGVFCALAYICTVFTSVFKMGFLTFDIKDAVITIGALYFGPASAVMMSAVISVIEMLTISDTVFLGCLMNFLSSAVFALTASLIYKYMRTIGGAVLGLSLSVLSMTAVMMVANIIITPLYLNATQMEVIKMIPTMLLPFNLIKGVFNASLVLLLYKPASTALSKAGVISLGTGGYKLGKKSIITAVSALLLIAASLAVFFLVLGGQIG